MEIVLDNGFSKKRTVNFKEGYINSIQSTNIKKLLLNLQKNDKIVYINNNNLYFAGGTVFKEIDLYTNSSYDDIFLSKILCSLELSDSFLDKKISFLSNTEKIYLNIIRRLLLSNNIVVFDDIFVGLDNFSCKKIYSLFNLLKERNYVILITCRSVDRLYKISDYSLVWSKSYFNYDTTDNIYTNVEALIKNRQAVPTLSLVTYKAKVEKNVKLFYSKDVRDIIKDIYKHV
ncbi:MAG: hypothetical protein J6A52_02670 [Bacilli bacterium]|nr:hypothetical protein [Bacilli bacterium]